MNLLLGILVMGFLWPMGIISLDTPLWDPVTNFTKDYLLLVALATVLSLIFHSWRLFCKMMAFLLPKGWPLQQWFESTWLRLNQQE